MKGKINREKEQNTQMREKTWDQLKAKDHLENRKYQKPTFWRPAIEKAELQVRVRIIREAKRAFFLHFLLYPLISSIKNSTGTKCISTISCRNRKACIFCTVVYHPVTFPKLSNKHILYAYRIHLKCIDFGFSQDSYYTENLFINNKNQTTKKLDHFQLTTITFLPHKMKKKNKNKHKTTTHFSSKNC